MVWCCFCWLLAVSGWCFTSSVAWVVGLMVLGWVWCICWFAWFGVGVVSGLVCFGNGLLEFAFAWWFGGSGVGV